MLNTIEQKEEALDALYRKWEGCTKCKLSELRNRIVFGSGNSDADIFVIGIGPGKEEDESGMPFVGESGGVVNDYIATIKASRNEFFFANIVQCRPYSLVEDFKTKRKREENRDPSLTEKTACRPLWQKMVYIVDPLLIIAMGKPTITEVSNKRSVSMTDSHGLIEACSIDGVFGPVIYPVMTMWHPAYLLRSGNQYKGGPWHQTLVAWQRAIYYVDRLRRLYYGTPIPDRGFTRRDLFLIDGGFLDETP